MIILVLKKIKANQLEEYKEDNISAVQFVEEVVDSWIRRALIDKVLEFYEENNGKNITKNLTDYDVWMSNVE